MVIQQVKRRQSMARIARICGLNGLARLMHNRLTILTYHYLVPGEPGHYLEVSLDVLRWQLDFIKEHYRIMPLPDALRAVEDGEEIKNSPLIAFTMDDGDAASVEIASREFSARGLHVTVGLPMGLILGKDDPTGLASWCIHHLCRLPDRKSFVREEFKLPEDEFELLDRLRAMDPAESRAVLKRIEDQVANKDPISTRRLLAPDELRPLPGISYAPHGMSHAPLAALSPKMIGWETGESKKLIEEKFGHCDTFFYPYGNASVFSNETEASFAKHGYTYALTYVADFIKKGTPRFRVPRIGMLNADGHAYLDSSINGGLFPLALVQSRAAFRLKKLVHGGCIGDAHLNRAGGGR